MHSKNNAPNASQKRWMEAVRSLGSILSGAPAVIHHAVGPTAKHNKIPIGHEWLIPLTDEEHKALHNGEQIWRRPEIMLGLTYEDYERRQDFEKMAFEHVCTMASLRYLRIPDDAVRAAIWSYHR